MQIATWSPGCTPPARSSRLKRLAAASSSAKVWVKPDPAMINVGLLGCESTKAPGYIRVERSRRYVAPMDPAATRFAELIDIAGNDRHLDLLCALVAAAMDRTADVGSIITDLDHLADTCPASFDGIIETLFSSGLFSGDSDDY